MIKNLKVVNERYANENIGYLSENKIRYKRDERKYADGVDKSLSECHSN